MKAVKPEPGSHAYDRQTGEYLGRVRIASNNMVYLGLPKTKPIEPTDERPGEVDSALIPNVICLADHPNVSSWPAPPAWRGRSIVDYCLALAGAIADGFAPPGEEGTVSMADLGRVVGAVNLNREPVTDEQLHGTEARASSTRWAPPPMWTGRDLGEYAQAIALAAFEAALGEDLPDTAPQHATQIVKTIDRKAD